MIFSWKHLHKLCERCEKNIPTASCTPFLKYSLLSPLSFSFSLPFFLRECRKIYSPYILLTEWMLSLMHFARKRHNKYARLQVIARKYREHPLRQNTDVGSAKFCLLLINIVFYTSNKYLILLGIYCIHKFLNLQFSFASQILHFVFMGNTFCIR